MASILDYLAWRGDLTIVERPFNEVDNLILAELSYLDFSGIVPAEFTGGGVPLADAVAAFTKRPPHADMGVLVPDTIPDLAQHMAQSARFRTLLLDGYVCTVDEGTQTQFSALTIRLPDGSVYIAYRGTDDTIVGWREDFNMAFLPTVPAQQHACRYLQATIAAYPACPLRLGGHSKGGNLAVYAAVHCGERAQEQITAVYNNDGPGFHSSLLGLPEHRRIADRIQTFLPESSVVGMLLEHEETYQVVKSNQIGLMQHDGFSWQVRGDRFVHLSDLTEGGKIVDKTLRAFVRGLSQQQREQFIDALFEVLTCTNAATLTDLKEGGFRTVYSMLKTVGNLDKDTRKALSSTLGLLVRSGAKSIGSSQPVQRLKNIKLVEWISGKLVKDDDPA